MFGCLQICLIQAFREPIVDRRQYSSRFVMSTLGHAQPRETQRRARLQGESSLSPGQAERGQKALLRAGPRLTDRLPKQQLTLETQQFGTVDELSSMVGTRQPFVDRGTGFGNLSEPKQAFRHGADEFRVPDRPTSPFAEPQFGAQ